MKVTILGCGGSLGVPMVGNQWGTVDRSNPKNRRRRPSILVEVGEARLLVDTGPDLRQQLLDANVESLDAVLYTHMHADHVAGLDDLRALTWKKQEPIHAFADAPTAAELAERFAYAVAGVRYDRGLYFPIIDLRTIEPGRMTFEGVPNGTSVQAFAQNHGAGFSMGYRFGDVAYSTDVSGLDDEAWRALEGTKIWIVDATRREPHPSHTHLDQTLEWIERLAPERAILTHMNHTMDYADLKANLPAGVEPAYDGLVIEL
ncbi:MAG: MBL fold metallo-hydrolase [Pseudomonadota bacterium]